MWQHDYTPVADSLGLSAVVAAIPLLVLFYMLGVRRQPSWLAASTGLAAACIVAVIAFQMPFTLAFAAVVYGAMFGLFPIGWIVLAAIVLFRLAVDTGKFEIIKDSIGGLSQDRRLQALFIAFSFGAFVEGAAGFGAPVAVSAAMLAGLGFPPFYAAGICLLANTAPVAFGSIGIPVLTLAGVTGLPVTALSAMVGRICAMISIAIPAYMVVVMAGARGAIEALPAIAACGVSFAAVQLFVSNTIGPELTDILSAIASLSTMAIVMRVWQPARIFRLPGEGPATAALRRHPPSDVIAAWMPYLLLVVFVLVWGAAPIKAQFERFTIPIQVPGLHHAVLRVPPVTSAPEPYAAVFSFNWLSASGTACLLAAVVAALLLRVSPRQFAGICQSTLRQLALPLVTIASMLALAYLMNYSGMTSTLGLAFAATGPAFPFFGSMLGWVGVFLTGSDTAANALFGKLQVVTAEAVGVSPVLMAAANSAGGVMGKMISLQNITVAVAATGRASTDESELFRFTLRHSVVLAIAVGLIVLAYAYLAPQLVPAA